MEEPSRQTDESATRRERHTHYTLNLLILLYVINYINHQILTILLKPIKHNLNTSNTTINLLTKLTFTLFYTTTKIPIARLADRDTRRDVITLGVAI